MQDEYLKSFWHVLFTRVSFLYVLQYLLFRCCHLIFVPQPSITIDILTTAILRLDPTASTFTSTHLLLMKYAAEKQAYLPAINIAKRDILYYPIPASSRHNMLGAFGETSKRGFFLGDETLASPVFITQANGFTDKITSAMILEYNYLRGLIFISQKDWSNAQVALEQVVGHPCRERGVSKIMVDSHNKWILVGLLNEGSTPVPPSYMSANAKNILVSLNHAYVEFSKAFSENNAADLKAVYEKHKSVFEEHKNLSLAEEVMQSYQQWQILQLRKAYSNITLKQIWHSTQNAYTGNQLSSEREVTDLIQSMIAKGALQATLESDADGVTYVLFEESSVVTTEAEYAQEIARCHRNVKQLTAQYKFMGEQLASNDEYVKHVARELKRTDKDGPDPGLGFDSQIEDEDLMTGIVAHG